MWLFACLFVGCVGTATAVECNIPRLVSLDQATFEREYQDQKPVIVASSQHRARNDKFYEASQSLRSE